MPCRPDERFAQGPAQPKATTRTGLTRNGGACCEEPEAEDPVEHAPEEGDVIDGDGEAGDQPKKRHRELFVYETVKTWVDGARSEYDPVDIQHQIQLAAREMMHESGQVKLPNHKEVKGEIAMWKPAQVHIDRYGVKSENFQCPLFHRSKCKMRLRLVTSPDLIALQRTGEHSHGVSYAKGLSHQQIIAVQEAVRTAPRVSPSQLRQNLLIHESPTKTIGPQHMRKVQRIVQNERRKVRQVQLQYDLDLDDSCGSLSLFAGKNRWSELVSRHNDQEDPYHLQLYEFCIIGHHLDAAHDIVRLNFSSPWMLLNALRSIASGWVFQLNGDVTGKVCRADIDLLELSVTSMPCQNNVLCISTIPRATESETAYKFTWDDLRLAVKLIFSIKLCECEICATIAELTRNPEVVEYTKTDYYADDKLPVDTAMCDNFK
jgi:hypothetical protein